MLTICSSNPTTLTIEKPLYVVYIILTVHNIDDSNDTRSNVSNRGPRNSYWIGSRLCLSLATALSTIQVTVRFGITILEFRSEKKWMEGRTSMAWPPRSLEMTHLDVIAYES
ncbi:hypothetical protein TNCV_1425911 [Trichonephila clavipes]|nr:hypothetical protein TNCV_1425911 [Trichonephila clavipes]